MRARHAVEMPRRGKRGKLKKRVSRPSLRAWKSGTKRRIPTFPQRRRRRWPSKLCRRRKTKPDRSLAMKTGQLDKLRTGGAAPRCIGAVPPPLTTKRRGHTEQIRAMLAQKPRFLTVAEQGGSD